ncbi:MAG: VPLPA-CTERM sorting domain-containing protein [Pikeienuella sp.]
MNIIKLLPIAAVAAFGLSESAGAATFGLDTTGGVAATLGAGYDLSEPTMPHSIVNFSGAGFGGLTVTPGATITATYMGSEAGASNGARLEFGLFAFSNATSSVGDSVTFMNTGNLVNLLFSTNNLGGDDAIDNSIGLSTDDRLNMAFTDISGATGDVTSVFAFFGDGAGDLDYDDMVIRLDISTVPLPAAGLLLLTGLAGIGFMSRRRASA